MNTTTLQELKAHHEQRAEELRELIRERLNIGIGGNLSFTERDALRTHEHFVEALSQALAKP